MIVFINLGSEAGNWYLGPLMMFVVPYLLNGGFHQLLAGLVYVVRPIMLLQLLRCQCNYILHYSSVTGEVHILPACIAA